jgi:hypothetical protein
MEDIMDLPDCREFEVIHDRGEDLGNFEGSFSFEE